MFCCLQQLKFSIYKQKFYNWQGNEEMFQAAVNIIRSAQMTALLGEAYMLRVGLCLKAADRVCDKIHISHLKCLRVKENINSNVNNNNDDDINKFQKRDMSMN